MTVTVVPLSARLPKKKEKKLTIAFYATRRNHVWNISVIDPKQAETDGLN
jgi:hypothetical protein